MTTYTGARTNIKRCPNDCLSGRFSTTAHVSQTWVVDSHGNFVEALSECDEVTHGPNFDNIWACQECGAEAVTIECIVFALARGETVIMVPTGPDYQNQVIISTQDNKGLIITASEISIAPNEVKFQLNGLTYLAHIDTDTLDEGV